MPVIVMTAPAAATGLTTLGLVSLVAGSSVLAAVLTLGVGAFRDWRNNRTEGKFAALYLALALDAYAKVCATLLYDVSNYHSSGGEIGKPHGNIPELPDYPTVNWNALGVGRTEAVMLFRVAVDESRGEIEFLHEVGDSEDVEAAVLATTIQHGVFAADLGRQLRRARGLRVPPVGWAEKHLRDTQAKRAKEAAAREARAAAAREAEADAT